MTAQEAELSVFGDTGNIEAVEIAHFQRAQAEEAATEDIVSALKTGDIRATGRFSDSMLSPSPDWNRITWAHHSKGRSEIPPDFWSEKGIEWSNNSAKSPDGEYAYIEFKIADVLKVWPLDAHEKSGDQAVANSDSWAPLPIDRQNPAFKDALEKSERALEIIRGDNGYSSTAPEERNEIVASLETGITTLKEGTPSRSKIRALLVEPLKYLTEKFTSTIIGEAAKLAFAALVKWLIGL